MTLTATNFAGTNGAPATTTTEPLWNTVAASGGSLTYDNTATLNGQATSLLVTASGSGIRNLRKTTGLSTRDVSAKIVWTEPTSGGSALLWFGVGPTRVLSVAHSGTRVLTLIDAVGATVPGFSVTLTGGVAYELDTYLHVDSVTATSGTVKVVLRVAGSTSTIVSSTCTVNLGTALLTAFYGIAGTTSSSLTSFNVHRLAIDDAAADVQAPWFTTTTVGPLGTLAHIGDSTSSQDGNGSTNVPAAYVTEGWLAGDVWFYGVGSKTINGSDANGKTTVQNIIDARAALPQEPAVWVIALGTNSRGASDATTASDVAAVMAQIGSSTPVLWVGISQATAAGGVDANSIRRNAYIMGLMATYPKMFFTNIDEHIRNGRDESTLWFSPADANNAHMSVAGYAIRNAFIADQAKRVVSNKTPWADVRAGATKAHAVYSGGVIVWTD